MSENHKWFPSLPSVPKGEHILSDGFLTTRHFHVSHFIKLPNVIRFYPDIILLLKTAIKLEKNKLWESSLQHNWAAGKPALVRQRRGVPPFKGEGWKEEGQRGRETTQLAASEQSWWWSLCFLRLRSLVGQNDIILFEPWCWGSSTDIPVSA